MLNKIMLQSKAFSNIQILVVSKKPGFEVKSFTCTVGYQVFFGLNPRQCFIPGCLHYDDLNVYSLSPVSNTLQNSLVKDDDHGSIV